MSTTAQQAQADLDALVTLAKTTLPQAIALLNQLAAANKAGTPLDAAAVEADIQAIKDQVAAVGTAVTADTPPPPPPPAP